MSVICELCGLKYENEMIVDKQYCDFTQCYDCLFSMNFNDQAILKGSMGYNLQQYIDISKKYHTQIQEIPCNRLSDSGGCYVCMSILDIPFENPNINQNITPNTTYNITSTESKKDNTSTTQLKSFITHDINIYDNIVNIDGNNDIMLTL